MPEVSVIIPIYNAERYLKRCVDSILAQTLKSFEVILVDDGSTDLGGDICRFYAKQDVRVNVIQKTNGGVSDARNTGIKAARGKYLMFCDADDYVAETWIEKLVNMICENNNAYVSCNYLEKPINGASVFRKLDYYELFKTGTSGGVNNKIYLSSIVKNNNIFFDTEVPIAEDVLFNVQYLGYCSNDYFYTEEQLYIYEKNNNGAMKKYYPYWMKYHLDAFYCRIPYMPQSSIDQYCKDWLSMFIPMFENIFDKRNHMSFKNKMNFNQKIFKSKEFRYCVSQIGQGDENEIILRLLKGESYYLYWIIFQGIRLKKMLIKK